MSNQSPQPASVGKPRPAKCYNCGGDHYLVACPEAVRAIPAGLAAAHAAKAASMAHSYDQADSNHSGSFNRPSKRQKITSVTTRHPHGPVVTHYAPPLAQVPQIQGHYGAQPMQNYHQQFPVPPQQNPQQMPVQNTAYGPYGAPYGGQPNPSTLQGHGHPNLSLQDYGQTNVNWSGQYMQPLSQTVPQQYDHQNAQGSNYYAGPVQQTYGNDHYAPQQAMGQQPQNYSSYQGIQPSYGQSYQQQSQYSAPSPGQVPHGSMLQPQSHQQAQTWEQPPQGHHTYYAANHQSSYPQFERPYLKRPNSSVVQKQPPYHANLSLPRLSGNRQSSDVNSVSYQGLAPPITRRPSTNLSFMQDWEAAAPYASKVDKKSTAILKSGESQETTVTQHKNGTRSLEGSVNGAETRNEGSDFEWELEKVFNEPKRRPADPIGCPLPVDYHEDPIPSPAHDAAEVICKYIRPTNLDEFKTDIRLSLHWPSLKSDPVFRDIDFSAPAKLLEGFGEWLQARVLSRRGTGPIDSDPVDSSSKRAVSEHQAMDQPPLGDMVSEDEQKSQMSPLAIKDKLASTPSVEASAHSGVARSSTPSFGVDDDAWAPQPGEGHFTTSPTEDPTEALLASLGVTGQPKPVTSKRGCLHSFGHRDDSRLEIIDHRPMRQDSGYVSQRNSYSNGSAGNTDNSATYGAYRQKHNGVNPPPPPPPLHLRRQADANYGSPSSDGSARGYNGSAASINENWHQVANQASSPMMPMFNEAYDTLPFKERKNSAKAPHLRQEDDVTPKLRRRQPKVADAYSRRW